ncbi:MAG: retention module-containing protein, partial [Endozoicomonas sp.]
MNSNINQVIGYVTEVQGDVVATAADGSQRVLQPGDPIYLNEQVSSEAGATAQFQLNNGQVVNVPGQSSIFLNAQFIASQSGSDIQEDVEAMQEAIAQGEDPSEVTEAPAGGEAQSSDSNPEDQGGYSSAPIVEREDDAFDNGLPDEGEDEALIEQEAFSAEPVQEEDSIPGNQAPLALSTTEVVTEDGSVLSGYVKATDGDAGDVLTYRLLSEPESGDLTLSPDGRFTFDPGEAFQYLGEEEQASVAFTFEVEDSRGAKGSAVVDIVVTGVNDTPEVSEIVAGEAGQNQETLSVNLLDHASDVDASDTLSVSHLRRVSGNEVGVRLSENGTELIVDPPAYRFLAEGEQETLRYEFRVMDSHGSYTVQTAEIVLSGSNDLPTVSSAVLAGADQNGQPFEVNLLQGAEDIDASDTLSIASLQLVAGDPRGITPSGGYSLNVNPSDYNYLGEGDIEEITYEYQVRDDQGGYVDQRATVTVEGRNDSPVSADNASTVTEDSAYSFTLSDF